MFVCRVLVELLRGSLDLAVVGSGCCWHTLWPRRFGSIEVLAAWGPGRLDGAVTIQSVLSNETWSLNKQDACQLCVSTNRMHAYSVPAQVTRSQPVPRMKWLNV